MTELCGSPSLALQESTMKCEQSRPAVSAAADRTQTNPHSSSPANCSARQYFGIFNFSNGSKRILRCLRKDTNSKMKTENVFSKIHLPRLRDGLGFTCPMRTGCAAFKSRRRRVSAMEIVCDRLTRRQFLLAGKKTCRPGPKPHSKRGSG